MPLSDCRGRRVQRDPGLGFLDPGIRIDGERERQSIPEFGPELVGGGVLKPELLLEPRPADRCRLLKHMEAIAKPYVDVERRRIILQPLDCGLIDRYRMLLQQFVEGLGELDPLLPRDPWPGAVSPPYGRDGASRIVFAIAVLVVASPPSSVAYPRYIVHADSRRACSRMWA